MEHKTPGRLRGYAFHTGPRPAKKATKFRCRQCGQKVWVDASLAREVITCPTYRHQIPAPRPGRLWLEVCGGVVLFLSGFSIGHGPPTKFQPSLPAPAAVIQNDGNKGAMKTEAIPKPRWFASQADND